MASSCVTFKLLDTTNLRRHDAMHLQYLLIQELPNMKRHVRTQFFQHGIKYVKSNLQAPHFRQLMSSVMADLS